MAIGPCDSRNAGIITIIAAIVIMTVPVEGQTLKCPPNECSPPTKPRSSVSLLLTDNFGQVYNSSPNCFPIFATLLYVCKEQDTQQFPPTSRFLLSRKCTGRGWLDDDDKENKQAPTCVKRGEHCLPPEIVPNFFVQIDKLNVSNVNPKVRYLEGTIATYKCMNPKLPKVQQTWQCTNKNGIIKKIMAPLFDAVYSWKQINLNKQDLHCDVPESRNDSTATKTTAVNNDFTTMKTTDVTNTISPSEFSHNDVLVIEDTYQQQTPQSNIIIGICGFVALVLIATLLGVCYKNRLMFGKRYGDGVRYESQPSPALMAEEQKCSQTDGQDLLYANIIPIKVNSETIYAEVQTGRMKGNGKPVKCTIRDDQLQTIYAEIHHPK